MDSADVWTEARAAASPGTLLIRWIGTMKNVQAFIEVPASNLALGHLIGTFDGGTCFDIPGYTIDQQQAIIADANAAWFRDHAGAPA